VASESTLTCPRTESGFHWVSFVVVGICAQTSASLAVIVLVEYCVDDFSSVEVLVYTVDGDR